MIKRLYLRCYRYYPLWLSISIMTVLTSCDRPEIAVYTVAKDSPPIDEAAYELVDQPPERKRVEPQWTVPVGWQQGKASSIRRGSFSVNGPSGQYLDISVTTFPGRVGGLLDNINRWRGQIGLDPIVQEAVPHFTTPIQIAGKNALLVDLLSEDQRTLAAILNHNGDDWFFKLTGSRDLAEQQYDAFLAFLESVRFP